MEINVIRDNYHAERSQARDNKDAYMIIADIVSQHVEEAAFLWLLRSSAIRQPHYALKDLAKLDERVEAHLDGLRVAGASDTWGWESFCIAGWMNSNLECDAAEQHSRIV